MSYRSYFSLLPTAFCFLLSAFCFLLSAFCLLPSAFRLPLGNEAREQRREDHSKNQP
jgi:hypothetical protein